MLLVVCKFFFLPFTYLAQLANISKLPYFILPMLDFIFFSKELTSSKYVKKNRIKELVDSKYFKTLKYLLVFMAKVGTTKK
jgi:hypothetical protein